MATDSSPSNLRGFGLPVGFTPSHLWDAESIYTQAGPQPGVPVPQGTYDLRLSSSGEQSASKALRILTQRAGNPGPDGASFVWKESTDTNYRGRDIQQISGFETLEFTTSAALKASDPDAITLADGTVLVARQKLIGGAYKVRVTYKAPSATSWTTVDAHTQTSVPTDGYHPAMTLLPDASILLAFWVYDAKADEAQLKTMRSTDDGVTWSTVSSFALDTPLDIQSTSGAGNAGFEAMRLRMSEANGQILIVARHKANNSSLSKRYGYIQAVSVDGGGRFVTVEDDTPTAYIWGAHSVVTVSGQFYLMVVTAGATLSGMRLSSGFEKITTARTAGFIDIAQSFDLQEDEGSAWVDDDGTIWFIGEETSSGQSMFMIQSVDDGDSFRFVGAGSSSSAAGSEWFNSGDSDVHPVDFVGTSSAGRQVIACSWDSDTATEGANSVGIIYLGGYSTITLPGVKTYASSDERTAWSHTWLPFDVPDHISSGPWTATGAGTDSLASGALNLSTSSNTIYYEANPTTTIAQGIIVRASLTVAGGGAVGTKQISLAIRTADSTNDYEAHLNFAAGSFRMIDANGSQIGTDKSAAPPNAGIEVIVAITSGKFSCWFRVKSSASDREWTAALTNHSLIDSSTLTNNLVQFGNVATSTSESDWTELHYIAGQSLSPDLGAGFTNPDDLFGRDYAGRGRATWVDDGVRITATDGAGREGESYHIDTRYRYPIDRIFWSESTTPRVGWRSTADNTATLIPLLMNPDEGTPGTNSQHILGDILILHMSGINFANFTIEYYSSAAWNVAATIDLALTGGTWNAVRANNTITLPLSGSNTSKVHLFQNELKGGTAKIGSSLYRITRNSEGLLAAGAAHKRIEVEVEGTAGGTESGALELWPDSVTVAINLLGVQGSAWGVRIAAEHTVDNDYRIGQLLLGRGYFTGYQYARGRVLTYEPNTPTTISPDGVLRGRQLGPGGRILRFAWTDMVDGTTLFGTTTDPNYITGSTSSGALPVGVRQDVPGSLQGMFREIGQNNPFIYLPRIPRSTSGPTDIITLNRRHQHLAATLTTPIEVEHVLGDEDQTEALRVASITAREIR